MYLKALRMRGFKSFPGSVELCFDHGIAVVVGPNGSGKSNIADALQWAMAVSSPVQLRAPTGQDVLFAGSDGRPPAGVCEVELVLDNECGTLPLEFSEVSVMRRLDRGGESEYLVNRARVRRLDVLELLSDTGLGREMHSVIGQGKVEEILLSKPHERRRFVEEAAGLGKYQRRRVRAESKLARVSSELERARDLEREVKGRLRPLALQATAAERAAKLGAEIATGRIALLTSDALTEGARVAADRGRLEAATTDRARAEARLAELAARRAKAESELTGLATAQERAGHAFYAFETARERLGLATDRLERARGAVARAAARRRAAAARLREDSERLGGERDRAARGRRERGARGAGSRRGRHGRGCRGGGDRRGRDGSDDGGAPRPRRSAGTGGHRPPRGRGVGAAGRTSCAREPRSSRRAATTAGRPWPRPRLPQPRRPRPSPPPTRSWRAAIAPPHRLAPTPTPPRWPSATPARQRPMPRAGSTSTARGWRLSTRRSSAARASRRRRARSRPRAPISSSRASRRMPASSGPSRRRSAGAPGAVVAERIEHALELLGRAEGEVAVVLREARPLEPTLPPSPGARPLSEVADVRDPAAARLIDGVWLVDDLAAVEHGVAVTREGAGIDAERGELWRAADAGEAAWMAARAERDRLAAEPGCRRARGSRCPDARRRGGGRGWIRPQPPRPRRGPSWRPLRRPTRPPRRRPARPPACAIAWSTSSRAATPPPTWRRTISRSRTGGGPTSTGLSRASR